jgi:MurNAc alpha-1-phosphate uridylyltransferase
MKAMIFAAGLGTRFKPFTNEHPKALAIVNQKSLLQRNVEYLQQYNITDVVVNVHHFGDQIVEAIKKNKGWGSHICISDERDEVLETGGGLAKAQHLLGGNEPFITINVDILSNLNIQHFIDFYTNHNPLITLAVTNRLTSRYFLFNQQNQLSGWRNVKTHEEKIIIPQTHYMQKAYSGIAIFNPSIFSLIRQQGKFSLTETYLDLAKTQSILGYEHSLDIILDVGNMEAVKTAEKLFQ